MKKVTVAGVFIAGLSGAHASQVPPSWTDTEEHRGDCRIFAATLSATADWRDNHVPLARAQSNVRQTLKKLPPAEGADPASVDAIVAQIYSSNTASTRLGNDLRAACGPLPPGVTSAPQNQPAVPKTDTAIESDKVRVCAIKGGIYRSAAFSRDQGQSPQDAFRYAEALTRAAPSIPEQFVKNAVNQVYFDPGFAYAGGEALQMQVALMCTGQRPAFQPLK